MLVEINLLPHKSKKSPAMLFLTLILFTITIVLIIVGSVFYQGQKQQLATIKSETEFTIKLREIEEERQRTEVVVTDFQQLLAKKDWIIGQQISAVFLLNHFVTLLPERGFFFDYTYNDQGRLTISVQFDSARDAANYLYHLNSSPYITEATLSNLTTTPWDVMDEEGNQETLPLDSDYLPRYTALYQLEVNRVAVKLAEAEEEDQ